MAETVIESIQEYLATCPLFAEKGLTPNVNWVDPEPDSYGIFPLPGEKVLERYPVKGGIYEYPFELQVSASNADDLARLQTQGYFEQLGDWLEEQNRNDDLPELPTNQAAIEIEALGQGYLLDQGDSDVSIYAVPCKLTYEKR